MTEPAQSQHPKEVNESELCSSWRRVMEGLLRALGIENKPDYTEKIPETLTENDLGVHETFHHGFPHQPTCLAYDAVQQLLAIGSETGAVLLLGKPGLERHFTHPSNAAVTHMRFVCNKGLLITCCSDNTLYLWSLCEKEPTIKHTLEFNRESPTCISYSTGSQWAYVGTDGGNVHVINVPTFKLSGYTVYWNHACEISSSRRTKPGNVIFISEHPMDQGKILIAFSNGLCVLFDMSHNEVRTTTQQKEDYHKRYNYDPGDHHILTSVCWQGNGRYFTCSYSNGCAVVWNIKTESKPEKIMYIHDSPDKTSFKPIHKVQVVHTDGDPWIFCSGGYPENNDVAPRTLTVVHGKSTTLVSSDSTILDFLCLPTSPYACDQQKPFALVILSKDELIVHDLLTPGLPRYPNVSLPYALDIHLPPVTSIQYLANCSDEFVASLHSVKSKLMNTSAKPWPLKGGKWGSEVPHTSTDLILTGHVDGSLRLWYCSSVIFQPFFTLTTARYFKMCYQAASTKLASPPARQPPARPPPPRKQQSQPPSQLNKVVSKLQVNKGLSTSQPEISKIGTKHSDDEDEVFSKKKTLPATGQISSEEHDISQDSPDGPRTTSTSDTLTISGTSEGGSTPGSERRTVYSREKRSIFKKKKRRESADPSVSNTIHTTRSPTPTESHTGDHHAKEEKKSPKVSRTSKSFRKVAKIVKLSRSVSSASDKGKRSSESVEEVDAGENDSGKDSPTESQNGASQQEQQQGEGGSTSPKRPSNIMIRESSQLNTLTGPTTGPGIILTPSDSSQETPGNAPGATSVDSRRSKSPTKMTARTPQLERVSETSEEAASSPLSFATRIPQLLEDEDEFFGINEIHMCLCGLWLCVANRGGCVMAFDFSLRSKTVEPKFLEINFDNDSIMRQYATRPTSPSNKTKSTSSTPTQSPRTHPTPGDWYFDDKVQDSKPGFQLTQVCMCYYTSVKSPNGSGSNTNGGQRLPVVVSTTQYSVDKGLLVVGTNRGFAIVDVFSNTCLYTFSSVTSILYMANPNKFSRQIRQESQRGLNAVKKPTISRHATSLAFSVKAKSNHSTSSSSYPVKRAASAKPLTMKAEKAKSPVSDQVNCSDEDGSHITISELESCVSAIELVQLQLDKQSPPTLTLWVGLASGYVAAYGINVIERPGQTRKQRRVEHIPTRFISESSGKHPIVDMFFLNEWGDQQVVPYKPKRTLSVGSEEQLQHVLQQERTRALQKAQTPSNAPQHYAIFIDEHQIRSFSFPGFVKITVCIPPLSKGGVILKNQYFMCNDLPCLLSITSCKYILVHSLPGLKPLLAHHFSPLGDPRVMCTFRVSGSGQAMFMSTTSEIQRMSIVKRDMLNLPECLPDVFIPVEDPPMGVSKGFLGGLFGTTPTTVDRERMFGEASRRPMGNLYKHDGKTGTAYSGNERRRSPSRNEPRAGGAKGLAGQMNRNVDALRERKDKLSAIERRTQEVSQNADEFASLAAQLARKYERR